MTSSPTTSPFSNDSAAKHPGRRIRLALLLSLVAGIPTYFLWAFLWVSLTETTAVLIGLAWAAFLFAFTYPATRARWGEVNGALASLLTALVAPVLAAGASVLVWIVVLIIAGGDPG